MVMIRWERFKNQIRKGERQTFNVGHWNLKLVHTMNLLFLRRQPRVLERTEWKFDKLTSPSVTDLIISQGDAILVCDGPMQVFSAL